MEIAHTNQTEDLAFLHSMARVALRLPEFDRQFWRPLKAKVSYSTYFCGVWCVCVCDPCPHREALMSSSYQSKVDRSPSQCMEGRAVMAQLNHWSRTAQALSTPADYMVTD